MKWITGLKWLLHWLSLQLTRERVPMGSQYTLSDINLCPDRYRFQVWEVGWDNVYFFKSLGVLIQKVWLSRMKYCRWLVNVCRRFVSWLYEFYLYGTFYKVYGFGLKKKIPIPYIFSWFQRLNFLLDFDSFTKFLLNFLKPTLSSFYRFRHWFLFCFKVVHTFLYFTT